MLHQRPRFLCFAFCALLFPLLTLSLFAQDFSADFVSMGKDTSASGPSKIFVGKDKMRVEGSERGQMGKMAMIMDFANHKSIILMPDQKMYMESMAGMGPRQQHMWFRPDDANNACPQFEAMAKQHNDNSVTCRKVGSETVNGRSAVKYEGSSKNGSGFVWIDRRLRFPIKWQDKNGGGELRNIQEGSQSASLFEVPSGFQKFDMQQMMRQRQQHQ